MVSGITWPNGDPFLQRQNEPSIAASTRNPLHLLAGANDYRSVDLPAVDNSKEPEHGDAWLGVFKSFDGGQTWQSTLLPGCPYATSVCTDVTLTGKYEAASDPVVRAGTNGMFYYSGIAFQRDQSAGVVFVARYIDNNNKENGDPIQYLGTSIVASGTAQNFLDKPWIGVDVPRTGAHTCTVKDVNGNTQSFPGGNVYISYASFIPPDDTQAAIWFSRSLDCGASWYPAQRIADSSAGNQGPAFAIDPLTGTVYLAWRQFSPSAGAIFVAKSTDHGASFSAPVKIANLSAFDQGTTADSFRTNAYPSLTADANGRVYIAWSDRTGPAGMDGCGGDCARIVVSSSSDGQTWSTPQLADPTPAPGHQWMPALTFSGGLLSLVYYDSRNDHYKGVEICPPDKTCDPSSLDASQYVEQLVNTYEDPGLVFTPSISDTSLNRRHTIDVRATQSLPGALLGFSPSVEVTQYLFGTSDMPKTLDPDSPLNISQLRYDPPNLPMFSSGTEPFLGDYIDVTPLPAFVPVVTGTRTVWRYNLNPSTGSVVQTAWTDNRDVIPPNDQDWTKYTPPTLPNQPAGPVHSVFDPKAFVPACAEQYAGTRNQNIYTARIASGVIAGSPGNTKPLSPTLERGFVVFVENTSSQPPAKVYRLSIPPGQQPPGGYASFVSKSVQSTLVTTLDVAVPSLSSISRTVFITSSNPHTSIAVSVAEIAGMPPVVVAGPGTQTTIQLNPDVTNPDITNPDVTNPDVTNPDVTNAEVYNPDITNLGQRTPDVTNPDITNPDITNPDVTNHDITSTDSTNKVAPNPDVTNPDVTNPDVTNPDIKNPDVTNTNISDTFYDITNNGNTAASYSIKLVLKGIEPPGIALQLLLYRVYKVPAVLGCNLFELRKNQLIGNILNPSLLTSPDVTNPDITNGDARNATLALAPGETARIDIRTASPPGTPLFNPATAVTVVATAHSVNTEDKANPAKPPTPPVASSGLTVLSGALAEGVVGDSFTTSLQIARSSAIVGPITWSITSGTLPPNLSLAPATGLITGVLISVGTFSFTATATDSANPPKTDSANVTITVAPPLQIVSTSPLPDGTVGVPYTYTLTATGGLGSDAWITTSGSLPPGLSLDPTGVISGTPTLAGSYHFGVIVTDSSSLGGTPSMTFDLTIH